MATASRISSSSRGLAKVQSKVVVPPYPGRFLQMKDRSKLGATKSPALIAIAIAIVLATNSGRARADDPSDKGPTGEASTPAATPDEAAPGTPRGQGGDKLSPTAAPPTSLPANIPPTPMSPVAQPAAAEVATTSWFSRPSLVLAAGEGARRMSLTIYGFVEADYIFDTTRSYNDAIGGDLCRPRRYLRRPNRA